MYSCKFCNSSFGTKSNLIRHQKTSKKCVNLQSNVVLPSYKCEFCLKELSTALVLIDHKTRCQIKKNITIKSLTEKVSILRTKFKSEKKKNDMLELKHAQISQTFENELLKKDVQILKKDMEIMELRKHLPRSSEISVDL
jgi:uncharacterized Zn-finger protein